MSAYEILKFVHVLAAIVWVGGALMFHVLAARAGASDDAARVQSLLGESEKLAKTYFMPASITVLVFGVITVLNGDLGFDHAWILGGIVGIIISIVLGAGILGPTGAKVAGQIQASGLDETARAGLAKMRNVSRIDLLILVVVIFLMVVKPGN
jgi:uncharacterized membrane protein